MHQHLHAALPIRELDNVVQPIIALLEVLLEKDPVRRFQNPTELLKAMPMIIGAVDAERTITCESLRMAPADLYAVPHKPPARLGPERISVARLPIQEAMFLGERRTSLC